MTWAFETELDMRFSDMDMNGHANHVAYLTFAEMARSRHLASMGAPSDKLVEHGIAVVVLNLTVNYLHELHFRPTVMCTSAYQFGTGKSFIGESSVVQDGVSVCEIRSVLGVLDLTQRRLRAEPEQQLRRVMEASQAPADLQGVK